MNPKTHIACCGAYCKTCKPFINGHCKGCKLGYAEGQRDINKARCKIKLCCFRDKSLETCADCAELDACQIIHSFQDKSGYKYKKYKQAMEFIRTHGYAKYIKLADKWKGPYGRLK